MKVAGRHFRTIWVDSDGTTINIIDQTLLPHRFEIMQLNCLGDAVTAIKDMQVRGAPLIGATAAYGMCLAALENASENSLRNAYKLLYNTRPTAVNLRWALEEMKKVILETSIQTRVDLLYQRASQICEEDVLNNQMIGNYGFEMINDVAKQLPIDREVNILTHCNAGWLATVDWGTALAPIYKAYDSGTKIHVWVGETRPRNQGASLTAWELGQHGVPHTIIADNVGGHLMQHGKVDLCIVGSDRTTSTGDVCNKIGTYMKALSAVDNGVPFYVALPSTTIDWEIDDGLVEIPIEERSTEELSTISGLDEEGNIRKVSITPQFSPIVNYAFDVTPSKYITALITEKGICPASEEGLNQLFKGGDRGE